MQSARKVGSAETRGHLKDAHGRVMSIAALLRQLASSDVAEVDLGVYLAQLCQSLGASMIEDHDRLTITAHSDGSKVAANVSVSLGLIVTELVINSLKHGFPDDRRGAITVDYKAVGDDWTLTVSDDGIGIPAAANTNAGLGTNIVNALAKHLQAEVVVSNGQPGTIVALVHAGTALTGDPFDIAETAV